MKAGNLDETAEAEKKGGKRRRRRKERGPDWRRESEIEIEA